MLTTFGPCDVVTMPLPLLNSYSQADGFSTSRLGSAGRRSLKATKYSTPLIVSTTLVIGAAILFEAGLSFLGLGDPNVITWGLMLGNSRPYILQTWWAVTFPGIAIFLTVLAISLVGDGLNDAFNPKLRER